MQKQDWVAVGIKILGVYVGMLAFIGAGSVLLGTAAQLMFRGDTPYKAIFIRLFLGLLQPLVQAAAGWLLLRKTSWCLKQAGLGVEPFQM